MENNNIKTGFIASSFDLLHAGHILMFQDAKEHCDFLVVALHIDPSLERKEKNKPIQSAQERLIQLSAVKYIDRIVLYQWEYELYDLLKSIKPDVRILGSDYIDKKYTGDDLGIEVYYHDRKYKYSSTELRNRIYEIEKKKRNE